MFSGAKGDIKVWNPFVESDDEYSTSRISLQSGPYYDFESIESGWAVSTNLIMKPLNCLQVHYHSLKNLLIPTTLSFFYFYLLINLFLPKFSGKSKSVWGQKNSIICILDGRFMPTMTLKML